MTSRREFIIGAGGAVALSAVTRKGAKAQEKIRRVGVLMNAANDDPEAQACLAALQQGLADLGWVTDRNLRIDQRWAVGEVDRYRQGVTELVALAPDDRTAYALAREDDSADGAYNGIVAVDLTSGRQTPIFNAPAGRRINSAVLSDDGRRFAFFTYTDRDGRTTATLATMQAEGGGYRQIHQTMKRVEDAPQQIQWSKDGRALFFLEDGQVMRIAAEGGVTEFTGLVRSSRDQPHGMSLSGDGRRLAFTDGAPRAVSRELWVLENVALK